ncbi:hypothetical protein PVK06_028554 [Gossypium arboreum]|uniref:Non-haem dioxygenase N-terminal domain-containing protein n=1 Tax=Gossypium arboreum TaxID=29729 RepID=A0ABR0P3I9_GOSAR|nr:hypothetical protein PVK06_028554 [Gossypium arboreum]
MCDALQLPIVDLSSPDRFSTANSIRQACIDHGFFYLVNHGVDEELVNKVFEQISKFFSLPIEEKMKVIIKNYNGYSPLFAGKLDTTLSTKGDSKEGFYVSQLAGDLNQWPLEGMSAGTKLLSLIALSLKLDEDFFEKVGAFNEPLASLGLLHYPGEVDSSNEEIYANIFFTLVKADLSGEIRATAGLGGCAKQEWVAFFLNPSKDCNVECLESCCSEDCPRRFPPIKALDYLEERLRLTYGL